MRKIILTAISASWILLLPAQEEQELKGKVVNRATLVGIGPTNILDTYLSPLEYSGLGYKLTNETFRQTSLAGGNIFAQTHFQAHLSYTNNKPDSAKEITFLANWHYALFYKFALAEGFNLYPGAATELGGGTIYNMRNGNNPVSIKANVNLLTSGLCTYRFKIKSTPLLARYQVNIPVIGAIFSPAYGQSYYELFSQNGFKSSTNIKLVSIHNYPTLRQTFSIDLPVSNTRIRLAYSWDAYQSTVNQIKMHFYTHTFMVGFSKDLVKLKRKKGTISSTLSPF